MFILTAHKKGSLKTKKTLHSLIVLKSVDLRGVPACYPGSYKTDASTCTDCSNGWSNSIIATGANTKHTVKTRIAPNYSPLKYCCLAFILIPKTW